MSRIIIRNETLRSRATDVIGALDLSKTWEVTVAPYRKKRSLPQNALYWKWCNEVVAMVARETGHTSDDLHRYFKRKFLKPQVTEVMGEVVEKYTTTTLTTIEMKEYMDRIYAFCTSELGLFLPVPGLTDDERM